MSALAVADRFMALPGSSSGTQLEKCQSQKSDLSLHVLDIMFMVTKLCFLPWHKKKGVLKKKAKKTEQGTGSEENL